ncbi:MAG: HEAT repeat domain-containing protein [Chthoniobacteraceae bacterium]
MRLLVFCLALLALLTAPAFAQKKKNEQLPARTEAEILKTVTLPEGYEATVFALPPMGGYPTSVSAAIDGTIFVAIDENGSLGRDRNPASIPSDPSIRTPGKVVRMRDTDGDGRADEFKTFCEVESPRGVIWDGVPTSSPSPSPSSSPSVSPSSSPSPSPSSSPSASPEARAEKEKGMRKEKASERFALPGTLYVMHPPNLTAYTDTDGDGRSDKQEDILTGLGFDLAFRGADHTTNGCRLAIDGFIYIAVGDYGFTKAVAKDGTTLSMRGGGIVRIRPDGTGFEIISHGQRNIYDVAVSPTLDLFTRDNTNDGGGWNVRLSFVPPGAHMGYPFLFKNFAEDMLQPLADLGGGSPCGALWLDEPGLPKGLFTVEWGAGGIMYHDDLVPDGAGWKVAAPAGGVDPASTHKRPPVKQNKWIAMTRPTDMDVDATGALFITSWEGATFNYNGPNAGYVLRVVKKDAPRGVVPDLGKASDIDFIKILTSESSALRAAAQRELLRRKMQPAIALRVFANAVDPKDAPQLQRPEAGGRREPFALPVRVAALETALQFAGAQGIAAGLPSFTRDENMREQVVRALGNDARVGGQFPTKLLIEALADKNTRVRAAAITALRRLHKTDAAPPILPLVADADPVVAHLAVRALSELKAVQPCLAALDSTDAKVQPGALRALYGIYDPAVVDGLLSRLPDAKGELRRGILNALCRLANQDAPYENPSVWWGTRPDTSGPVYQPIAWSETPKITAALKTAVEQSNADDAKWLVQRMYQTKVSFPGLVELMLANAGSDTPAKLDAIEGMVRADNSLPAEAVAALQAIGTGGDAPDLRVRALRVLQRCAENGSVFPGAVAAFAPLAGHDLGDAKLTAAFEDFTRGAHNGKWVGDYAKMLEGADAPKRQLAATVLVNLSTSRVGKEQDRDAAKKAVEKGFAKPEPAAALLAAIARTGAKPYAEQVKAKLNDPNNAVAEAALFAFQKLGGGTAPAKTIGEMKYEEVFAAVQKGGDAKAGGEMFLKAGCIACHTITADEPPKGPVLSAAAKIYDRAALTESLLKPSAKLAQGFESVWIKTKKGEQLEGFVTREGGDNLDLRNIAGQTVLVEKADIAERGHRDISMMPEGLLNAFTPAELADLLAWMESLK